MEIFNPGKNRTVDVKTKDGARAYSYDYAELNVVTEIIRKPLASNGLTFTQSPTFNGSKPFVETVLQHESGEERSYLYPLYTTERQGMKNEQIFASGFTYAKRQALKGIFGIADDTEDVDAQDGTPGVTVKPKVKAAGPAPATKAGPVAKPQPKPDPHASPPMPDYENEPQAPSLYDQFIWTVEEKGIPSADMPDIIAKVCGQKKKSTEMTDDELTRTIDFVKKFVQPKKAE